MWFVAPFLLTLMARILFREEVSAIQWLAIAAGFAGIVMVIRPSPETWERIYLVGLLAGFGYAVFLLLTRLIETGTPPVVSVYQTGLVGGFVSTALVGAVWQRPPPIGRC